MGSFIYGNVRGVLEVMFRNFRRGNEKKGKGYTVLSVLNPFITN